MTDLQSKSNQSAVNVSDEPKPTGRDKPLPYKAGQFVDEALMTNSEIKRIFQNMIEMHLPIEEIVRQAGKGLVEIDKSSQALKNAKMCGE